jgi:hypothetical protein
MIKRQTRARESWRRERYFCYVINLRSFMLFYVAQCFWTQRVGIMRSYQFVELFLWLCRIIISPTLSHPFHEINIKPEISFHSEDASDFFSFRHECLSEDWDRLRPDKRLSVMKIFISCALHFASFLSAQILKLMRHKIFDWTIDYSITNSETNWLNEFLKWIAFLFV